MASSSYKKMEVDKFNGSNFELWKLKMEDFLEDHDLWEATSLDVRPTKYLKKIGILRIRKLSVSLDSI